MDAVRTGAQALQDCPQTVRESFELPVVPVPRYDALQWFIAWGRAVALAAAIIPAVIAGSLLRNDGGLLEAALLVASGLVTGGMILVVRDLARVIADMLLPR